MRFALRNKDKIAARFSDSYVKENIMKSLSHYFTHNSDAELLNMLDFDAGLPNNYPALTINDVCNEKRMLQFAVTSREYDVLHLAFCGSMKE